MAGAKKNEKRILSTFKGEIDEGLLEDEFLEEEIEEEIEKEIVKKNRAPAGREAEAWDQKKKEKEKTNEKKQKRQDKI